MPKATLRTWGASSVWSAPLQAKKQHTNGFARIGLLGADGRETRLCMFFVWQSDVALPSVKHHCAVMQMLRSFGPSWTRYEDQISGERSLTHSIHAITFTPFTRIVAIKVRNGPQKCMNLRHVRSERIPEFFRHPANNSLEKHEDQILRFLSATRSRIEILTKKNLVGAKTAPTAISRTFTPLLRRIRFPLQGFTSPTQNQMEYRQTLGSGVESRS